MTIVLILHFPWQINTILLFSHTSYRCKVQYMKITVWGTHFPYSNSREIYNSDSLCYLIIVSICGAVTSLGKVIEIVKVYISLKNLY